MVSSGREARGWARRKAAAEGEDREEKSGDRTQSVRALIREQWTCDVVIVGIKRRWENGTQKKNHTYNSNDSNEIVLIGFGKGLRRT